MRLSELTAHLPAIHRRLGPDPEVGGIAADSRRVRPGDLFVAIPGVSLDGHAYIPDALASGAVAVVGERAPEQMPGLPWGTFAYIQVPDARQAWGWLCAAWEGLPGRRMTLVGVTGTDGKTTTVTLIHSILRAAGLNAGLVSTVAARIGEEEVDTGFHTTTPDPPDLQRYLARMVETGATHAVLEVTSHGLAQHRVAGCDFDVAVVTNITHEHLDFHGSLEAYRRAKAMLFEGLTRSFRKPGVPKVAVLNRDDSSYDLLRPIPADRHITYSRSGPADVTVGEVRHAPDATRLTLNLPDGPAEVTTPLVGAYNVSNILAAAAAAVALGIPADAIARGIAAVRGVPGRMERIDEGQDFLAIVDFAHTPNALEQALRTAREMARGRVIVVFGCAGTAGPAEADADGAGRGGTGGRGGPDRRGPPDGEPGRDYGDQRGGGAGGRKARRGGPLPRPRPGGGHPAGLSDGPRRRRGHRLRQGARTVYVLRDGGVPLGRPGGDAAGPPRPDAGYAPHGSPKVGERARH
jgi:UDP-N-acetylmuramoyl-L-alanyl-D-glutamate--2,6-diaminopimelate ligase